MSDQTEKALILKTGGLGDCILAFPLAKLCQEKYGPDNVIFAAPEGIRPLARLCGINKFADVDTVGIHQFFAESFDPRKSSVFFGGIAVVFNLLTDAEHAVHRNLSALHAEVRSLRPPHEGIRMHAAEYTASILGEGEVKPALINPSSFKNIHPDIQTIFRGDRPVIAVHPGTGSLKKLIGTGPFEDMISRMSGEYTPVLITGPADSDLGHFCEHMAREFDGYYFDSIPLAQIAYIIHKSRLYCGLDSGVSHLAALTGTQCRVVFTVTDPDVWRPYGPNVEIIGPEDL